MWELLGEVCRCPHRTGLRRWVQRAGAVVWVSRKAGTAIGYLGNGAGAELAATGGRPSVAGEEAATALAWVGVCDLGQDPCTP